MNRQELTDATTLQDVPVPTYLLEKIAEGTKASARDAEKTADFLLGRLGKSNLVVKLKALQTISFCVREGSPAFADAIREEAGEISAYVQCTGPPDPVLGDERYRRIRVASQEVLVCLNDRTLHEHSSGWGAGSAPSGDVGGYNQGAVGGGYGQSSGAAQGMRSPSRPPQPTTGNRWGPSGGSNQGASPARPTTYSDRPSTQYGGASGGGLYDNSQSQYGNSQGQGQYGGSQGQYGGASSGGGWGYGGNSDSRAQEQPSGGYGGNSGGNASQSSGRFGSWSQSSAGTAAPSNAPKAGGMWSSSGFQQVSPPPQYGASSSSYSSRDNRPTVLVGQTVGLPSSVNRYGNLAASSAMQMGGGFNGHIGGVSSSGFGSSSSSNPSRYRSNFSSSSSSGQPRSYVENMNRMLSAPGGAMPGADLMAGDLGPKGTLGKTYDGLKKISLEAKDKWDSRNMDKSVTTSLAQHDALTSTPGMVDRTYFHPSMHQQTGGGDKTGDYERGMIDNLCAAGGLARAPPSDMLKRFVELAQSLEVQTIGDIMLDKLEDSAWQVRLKALHVVLALIESPGSAHYVELFEDNAGVFEELRSDSKPTVAAKALQVLQVLGLAGTDETTRRAPKHTRSPAARSPAARPQGQQEVDILGMASLSLEPTPAQPPQPAPVPVAVPATVDLLGSPPPPKVRAATAAATPPPPAPVHVSLLDGFDDMITHPPIQQAPMYAQPNPAGLAPTQQLGVLIPPQHETDRSKALGDYGKDLFAIATSPRTANAADNASDVTAAATTASSEQSAFSFM